MLIDKFKKAGRDPYVLALVYAFIGHPVGVDTIGNRDCIDCGRCQL